MKNNNVLTVLGEQNMRNYFTKNFIKSVLWIKMLGEVNHISVQNNIWLYRKIMEFTKTKTFYI